MEALRICPYCGEEVSVWIDVHGGSTQRYVEDCPVCCRPWEVVIASDGEGDFDVSLVRQGD